jgi:hypothetical protein
MAEIERMVNGIREQTTEFTMPICRKQALESFSLSFLMPNTTTKQSPSSKPLVSRDFYIAMWAKWKLKMKLNYLSECGSPDKDKKM